MQNAQSSTGRLQFLDTLRGLAAAYVVLYHMVVLPDPGLATPMWVDKFAYAGGTGVTLFFIVSAFSLFYTMPFRLAKPRPVLSFYLHRFFRIAPLFYAAIAGTILRQYHASGTTPSSGEIFSSLLFVFNLVPEGQQGFVWAGWTIGVEMLFYAVFPFVYFRTRSIYAAFSWLIGFLALWQVIKLGVAYLPLSDLQRASIIQWSVFKHLPIFACGAIAFFLVKAHFERDPSPRTRAKGHALLLAGVFSYIALLHGWIPNLLGDTYYLQGPIYVLILVGLCYAPLKAIVNRVTMHLGQISYSVYLLHPTVVALLVPAYRRIYSHVPTHSLALLACFALTLGIVILISEFTYRCIEVPGIKCGVYVYRRWFAAPAVIEPVIAQ